MSLLEIKNLKKKYGSFEALKGLSFHVNAGEIVALIGVNGAGKTTILNSIAGNIYPTSGDILYKGETLLKKESRLNEFGILIEPTFIPYMNAYENLKILAKTSGVEDADNKVESLLRAVGLESKTKERTKAFSFGMKQRLGLAQTLLNNPMFLILDEPFVGLDPIGKEIFKKIILEKAHRDKVGILFSSHDLEDVEEICDRILLIDGGEKKFDGVMEYTKKYVIYCNQAVDREVFDNDDEIVTEEKKISTEDVDKVQEIFKHLDEQNINVVNIEVEKKSLYDLFKEE